MLPESFFESLWQLFIELRSVNGLGPLDATIFGSTALAVRGIIHRTPDDIDVMVSKRVWGSLLPAPTWVVDTPNAGDPPILTNPTVPNHLHLFFDWRDDAVEIDPEYLMQTSESIHVPSIGRLSFASVEEVRRHKEAAFSYGTAAVQKHGPDIAAIDAYLSGASVR